MPRLLSKVDFNKTQMMQGVVQHLSAAAIAALTGMVEGQLVYDTTNHKLMYYTGSMWLDPASSVELQLTGDVTGTASDGMLAATIGDGKVTTAKLADLAVTDDKLATITAAGKIANSATTADANSATANSIVARDAEGHFTATSITLTTAPAAPTDAATKGYVDAVISGLDLKASVRVVSRASNIMLAGLSTPIDGVALAAGDRVLVAAQTNPAENGIYVASNGSWPRASDADNTPGNEIDSGTFCFVESGSTYRGTGWVLTHRAAPGTFVLGTTTLTVSQFSAAGMISAGDGLTQVGTVISIADLGVTTAKLADLAVTEVKLADGAVTEGKLADAAVTTAKLAADAVTETKIRAFAVDTGHIKNSAITEGKLVDGAVTNVKLAANAVTEVKLADGAVTTPKLADLAVTTAKLADLAVTNAKLAGEITDDKLATIWSTGKVANSATTATPWNSNDTIVQRHSDGTFQAQQITIWGAPSDAKHAATKEYVDSVASGLVVKPAASLATAAALPAYTVSENKLVLTASAPGKLNVDGWDVWPYCRVLVKNEADGLAANNGIYQVTNPGSTTEAWVLTRSADADNSPGGEISTGMFCFVGGGVANSGTGWTLVTMDWVTVGATALHFTQFSEAGVTQAGTGLRKDGTYLHLTDTGVAAGDYFKVSVDAQGRVTAGSNPTTLAGFGITDGARRLETLFGDGVATAYSIPHTLASQFPVVTVYDVATNETVLCDVKALDANTLQVFNLAVAPSEDGLRIVAVA